MRRALITGLCALSSGACLAQAYPSKPIRLVIPVASGTSSNDILGRALAKSLSEGLGQPLVADNQPGASGTIGSRTVARAAPDGYTLLLAYSGAQTISPIVLPDLGYDTLKDLAPVSRFTTIPYVMVTHPSVPARTLKEFIAYAKSTPLNYASSGQGSTTHLAAELLKLEAGIDMTHVSYKAANLAANDIVAGRVQAYFSGVTSVAPLIKAGKLRALVVTMPERSAVLPDTPTATEAGLPGLAVSAWNGIMAPGRTPDPIINKLYTEIVKAANAQEMKSFLTTQGVEPAPLPPARFGELIRSELATWTKVIKTANIQMN